MVRSVLLGATLMLLGSACGGRSTIDYGVLPSGSGGVNSVGGSGFGANGGASSGGFTGATGGASSGGSGGVVTAGAGGQAGASTGGVGGGTGGSGTGGSGTGGSGGSGPLACFQCIGQQCPSVQKCLLNQACRQGAICAVQNCLSGGGTGGLDFQCVAKCFNGNLNAALQAVQGLQCVFSSCGTQCQNGIPGLPGGGGGGLPGADAGP